MGDPQYPPKEHHHCIKTIVQKVLTLKNIARVLNCPGFTILHSLFALSFDLFVTLIKCPKFQSEVAKAIK